MIYALILAGGKGTRMGNTDMPKQFLNIGERPIIIHTIEKFLLCNKIDKIVILTPESWIEHTIDLIYKYIPHNIIDKINIYKGGENRNISIMNGIEYIKEKLSDNKEDIIVTHDAVRPFITPRIIEDNIEMAIKYGATDTVIPSYDTIVESKNGDFISQIPRRDFMYQGQTPQAFNIDRLLKLYNSLTEEEKAYLTDAAKIFSVKGEDVKLVKGELFNMKITTNYDLKLANILVESDINDK